MDDCKTTLHEILAGGGHGGLGDLLDILDLACGRCAFRYANAPVVTASFQDAELYAPVPRGRLIQVTARVISTGTSSILLEVVGEAHDADFNLVKIIRAYSTFVCVKKGHDMPKLSISIPQDHAAIAARLSAARKSVRALYDYNSNSKIGADSGYGGTKIIRFQKQYLPRHKNFSEMVFGGDLLEGAMKIAVYTAMQLKPISTSSNIRGECIGFKYFNFVKPIAPLNLWGITAKISHVQGNIVFVDLRADIDEDPAKVSHEALYAVVFVDTDIDSNNIISILKPKIHSAAPDTNGADNYTNTKDGVDEMAAARARFWCEETNSNNCLWYSANAK